MVIAFFDFDGTITKEDSFIKFIKFAVGKKRFIKGFITLSPILISYKLGIISNYRAKEIVLSYFFKGLSENEFKKLAKNFSLNEIDKITRKKAIDRLNWHQNQNHKIVIVSASIECWLKDWCELHKYDLISTTLEVKNGLISGKLLSKNCYGIEKVNRIKDSYDLSKFDFIYSYGDSGGDKEMLKIANESFYKPFH